MYVHICMYNVCIFILLGQYRQRLMRQLTLKISDCKYLPKRSNMFVYQRSHSNLKDKYVLLTNKLAI
jgi:hypothetical protein